LIKYREKVPNFGYNGLGEFVYKRTYARLKPDNTLEDWHETVKRVVEGTFNLLIHHYEKNKIKIPKEEIEQIKKEGDLMYEKIFNFKFLPPGRGLWSMGTNITDYKKMFTSLNNCAFVSTKLKENYTLEDIIKPYLFLMDNSMLGVGIGFDTKVSQSNIFIKGISNEKPKELIIEDSREGWVESLNVLLKAYLIGLEKPIFNYSNLRPAGSPLKIFGGVSAGPKPLMELHNSIEEVLISYTNKKIDSRFVVDIMNLIGRSVVAGNISKNKI
jgi:ribonucleoside-triphosphate reductase